MTKISKTTKTSGKTQIVFFGSGPVAAKSLQLLQKNFEIEAVVTKPRPEHHRGDTPVLELCNELGLKSFTPTNKAELSKLFTTRPVTSTLGVVIDYGIIIAQDVIDYFPLGIVNSHFSLLPQWRGADPITFAILSGETKTGVSLMLIDKGMDTGKLITQKTYHLPDDITTPQLTNDLIQLSNMLLTEYLPRYASGDVTPRNQPHPDRATYSRKLTKEDGILDFNKPAAVLEREVRAFIDWPKSRTKIADKDVIITKVYAVPSTGPDEKPGDIGVVKEAKSIYVSTSSGSLWIQQLKPAGKKEMTAEAFLAGHKNLLS